MDEILDAGAMIAYLQGEAGGDLVRDLLGRPDRTCHAHVVNVAEVYYHLIRAFDERRAEAAIVDLASDGVRFRRDLSEPFWKDLARLKARGKLSIADCFCLTLACRLGGEVVTTDRKEFGPLVPLGLCPIAFIR